MGACLSCLGHDETDANERTSLLGGAKIYSDEDLHEEAWKQQQRQNELNTIVNDLNDHLIDVSAFLSNTSSGVVNTLSHPGSSYSLPRLHDGDDADTVAQSPSVGPAGSDVADRQYPHLSSVDEKLEILKAVKSLDAEDQKYDVVQPSGPFRHQPINVSHVSESDFHYQFICLHEFKRIMLLVDVVTAYVRRFDAHFVQIMSSHWFTNDLIQNPVSSVISEFLFVLFVCLLTYESIYWTGIYLGLWEYHAREIFTEVPVHCAHVYVRINFARKADLDKVKQYYKLKHDSTYNILNWKRLNELGQDTFGLQKFVKYHFEFSPEDFENNPEPEFGSTIEHLREKILDTIHESSVYSEFKKDKQIFSKEDVFLLNNKTIEVGHESDKVYLSKIHIETGNVIDAVVVY